ncbi:uncharacterized protein EI90DRAFT_87913 [Cantharellus anzutake]|uniref:uncharacterized protein n=1 Tax=Cantharellus anzutake TaxID=1750568 RepID=UPI0019040480|nr:uncharacterized protein EI90DRAFT_87913 [Cantharellus anzutake]KAF8336928.1 hypothetical protein EI90DRAFT_87913 [Cantharellus anzutake]
MCYTTDYIIGLDSYTQRNLLQNVSLNKISKLLEKVHAIAEEEGFRLRAHRDYGDDQLSLTTSQARGQGAESIITHTPTQRGANINVPSEQFASSLPPRQTPSQPSLGYTTAATYPFPLPNMLPPGVIDGALCLGTVHQPTACAAGLIPILALQALIILSCL